MLRDMMPQFELYQPDTLENALKLAKDLDDKGWILAGGYDSLDWFKDRAKRPGAVIDIGGIASLKGIRETPEGLEVGALTTLTEIATDKTVLEKYSLLASAASHVASPQIRNAGTIGGNLSQDARCWYYRSGVNCYRAGGTSCFADTPQGQNREHCLYGASRCVAVSPSDVGTASVALDARMNFGVLHLPEPERAFAEAARVLRPHGRYAFTLWAGPAHSPGAAIVENAISAHADKSVKLPDGPAYFSYESARECAAILARAGFDVDSLEFRTVTREWQVPTGEFVFEAERDAGVRTAAVLTAQTAATQSAIRADVIAAVRAYASDGGFRIPYAAHIVAISVT